MEDLQAVFCDVDGTLLNSRLEISPKTLEAVKGILAKGIPFVIATARGPEAVYPICREYGLACPMIAYSGALILDETGAVLFRREMEKSEGKRVTDALDAAGFDYIWNYYSLHDWVSKDRTSDWVLEEERIVGIRSVEGTIDQVRDSGIAKLWCMCKEREAPAIAEKLKAEFPHLSLLMHSDASLEVMAEGVGKAQAVRFLCGKWGIDPEHAAAFGDSRNDLEMLRAVGRGYLMGNAPPELKAEYPLQTEDNDHDGIYHALRQLAEEL